MHCLALAPLAAMAERCDAAIVCIVHLNKSVTTEVIAKVSGSIGIVAAARSVLLVGPDPDDPDGPTRVLAHCKCNVGALAQSERFRLESRILPNPQGCILTSGLSWVGQAPDVSARDLIAPDADGRNALAEAQDFLRAALANGPRRADDLFRDGHGLRLSDATLQRAKRVLGIRSRKSGLREGWVWMLPDEEPRPGEDDHGTIRNQSG